MLLFTDNFKILFECFLIPKYKYIITHLWTSFNNISSKNNVNDDNKPFAD